MLKVNILCENNDLLTVQHIVLLYTEIYYKTYQQLCCGKCIIYNSGMRLNQLLVDFVFFKITMWRGCSSEQAKRFIVKQSVNQVPTQMF